MPRAKKNTLVREDGRLFFVEDNTDFDKYYYHLTGVVAEQSTPYQDVLVAESKSYGRMLFLDGAIQSAENDEALYHEMLVQPAMIVHACPLDVLIIGGGEGATLREVIAHKQVKRVTMVDLDAQVVELCRLHLGPWHQGSFDDKRAHLVIGDGRNFVEEDESLYDVVIVDVVDSLEGGPAARIYSQEFYAHLR
jgi:spermidine synthase